MDIRKSRIFNNWWLLLLKGILIFAFGLTFIYAFWGSLSSKAPNYKVLIYAFIIIALINGLLILFGTFFYQKTNSQWIYWLMEGTFDFLIGVVGIIGIMILGAVKTHILNMFFIQIISFWAFIHGLIHALSARRLRTYVPYSRYSLFASTLVMLLSIIPFIKPLISTIHDTIFVGVFLIIIGFLISSISINLRKIYSD
jgi:uncharacterized membrane protein HdeD (DUF308 family)